MGIYVYQDEVSSPEKKLKNFNFNWKDKSILELGANIGKLGLYALEKGARKYKGVEIDKEIVKLGIERYKLDLVCADASVWKDFDWDVTIAMALFHHFKEDKLTTLLSEIKSKELIFEVPVGSNDVGLYNTRTLEKYTELIEKCYGEVVEVIESGATNDPYNKRTIFYCKKK